MNKLVSKIDMAVLKAKMALMEKKEASDQLIVMFIIIAVVAGIAGLLYIFATGTLLPEQTHEPDQQLVQSFIRRAYDQR